LTDPAEPPLSEEDRRLFERGIEEFNTGYFFECHETLEDLWQGTRGPSRDFFQGLIQIAVALYHLTRGNLAGSRSLFQRGMSRLEKYPPLYYGVDVGELREEARLWLSRVEGGVFTEPDLAALPKVRRHSN